tara:strand:+ start:366 stop:875 length:510 start_codon:yes stop_codon:yes gene_type:complete
MTIFKKYLYGAYGSNMNQDQMELRSPKAKPYGLILLPDHQLVFRGVADIEESKGSDIPIALWEITAKDEAALDAYEGYPWLYDKFKISVKGIDRKVMIYKMTDRSYQAPPSKSYLSSIAVGYAQFKADPEYIKGAVKRSFIQTSTESVMKDDQPTQPRRRDLWSPLDRH